MKSTLLDATGSKDVALIFDKGDEAVAGLTAFAKARSWAPRTSRRSGPSAT